MTGEGGVVVVHSFIMSQSSDIGEGAMDHPLKYTRVVWVDIGCSSDGAMSLSRINNIK